MGNYYFLAASLPPLALGSRPDITFDSLAKMLALNLSPEDYQKTVVIRRSIDLANIRALLMEDRIDPRGNLNEKELDEALLVHDGLPQYVFDFLERYDTLAERIRNFSQLMATFYSEEIAKADGFLKRYLKFEREWRLVVLGLRAKTLKRDAAKELQFEDFSDPLVAQILAQRDSEKYDPPPEYTELKDLFQAAGSDPWKLHKAFDEWRFYKVEDMVKTPLFSIDWILAYMVQLLIVEHWNELNEKEGNMILDTFKSD